MELVEMGLVTHEWEVVLGLQLMRDWKATWWMGGRGAEDVALGDYLLA